MIDLRSDTVTKPTAAMRQAMSLAEVGDDVYGEDVTVNRLEAVAAEIVGKEAALFVPTGSMGNQLAIMTHCGRGEEVICDANAHIFHYEMAAAGLLSGVQLYPLANLHSDAGIGSLSEYIREPLSYLPRTRLICLENTLNRAGGTVINLAQMASVYRLAREYGLKVHLDGARIFNAAYALQCEAKELTRYCDSVMFCLSKGLGAPVGSILAGSVDFITQARRCRKLLGGGMRQVGVLAAAGLVALADTSHLLVDHEKARRLAIMLAQLPGVKVDPAAVETNILLMELEKMPLGQFLEESQSRGLLAGPMGRQMVRFVTHCDVSMEDVEQAGKLIGELLL
ncbi:MAG: beta-eliminating lyase-related protein [Firmicutes bacterium]|nr:beta-eliminating lyase-related protein [Bacillota bacterium]MCL5992774.1 beta-eliminating lyase-related protein [Bacillota bacterium]